MENKKYLLTKSDQGENFDYENDHVYIKSSSNFNNGEFMLVEDKIKPNFNLGLHYHKYMSEIFYILEGEHKFTVEGEEIILKPGDTLTIPPMTKHEAISINGGKMLTFFNKGRFDEMLKKMNVLIEKGIQDPKEYDKLSVEYDTIMVK